MGRCPGTSPVKRNAAPVSRMTSPARRSMKTRQSTHGFRLRP